MQKIWLGIFASMFLVPEILWSPIMNYVLPFFMGSSYKFRDSFLFSGYTSSMITTLVIFIQFIGVLLFTILLYKNKESLKYKNLILGISFFISLISLLVLFLQLMLSKSDLLGL